MRKYTADQMTTILSMLDEMDIMYKAEYGGGEIITKEMVDAFLEESKEDNSIWIVNNINLLYELVDYKLEIESYGDHKNDGQMVEYEIGFTNPSGEVSGFGTEMCLMVGWNICEDIEIN